MRHIFADASAGADVSRIVYLGEFVPADGEMSPHLRNRADVGRILAAGSVDAVLLQAAVIVGAGSTSFEIIRHLVDRLPVVPLPPFSPAGRRRTRRPRPDLVGAVVLAPRRAGSRDPQG